MRPCQIFFSWRSTACNKTEFFLNPQRFSSDNSSAVWWQSQKWISKYASQKTTCTHDRQCQSSFKNFNDENQLFLHRLWGIAESGSVTIQHISRYFKVISTLWRKVEITKAPSKVCTMLSSRSSISSYSRPRFSSAAFTAFSSCLKIIGMLQDAFKSHLLCPTDLISFVPTERLNSFEMMLGLKRSAPECSLHIDRYCLGTRSFPMHICNIPRHSKASENTWPFHFKHVQTKFNLI